MKNTHKLIVAGITSCSLFGVISCSNAPDTTAQPIAANAKVETVTLALSGLKCISACPPKVQFALSSLDGVSTASATKTSATVELDRNKVTEAQLIAAVRSAGEGFDATVVK